MSADFWAGYISGAAGILIGNPLDVIKVRLQATTTTTAPASPLLPPPPPPPPLLPLPRQPSSSSALPGPYPLSHAAPPGRLARSWATLRSLAAGTAAPVLGYGALNALLFVSYNQTEAVLNRAVGGGGGGTGSNLWTTWIAGAVGGLATWVVSTPTELVKCRAQLAPASSSSPPAGPLLSSQSSASSSWAVAKRIWRAEGGGGGVRGFYLGGTVTALRDSVGYGFYFWSYELCSRWAGRLGDGDGDDAGPLAADLMRSEAARVLLCGGVAGVVTWLSIFPLDTIKTRVQAQQLGWPATATAAAAAATAGLPAPVASERSPLMLSGSRAGGGRGGLLAQRPGDKTQQRLMGAVEVARQAYREGGVRVFFRGLTVCSVRAFVVNAAQWTVYEWIMREMGQGRESRASTAVDAMELA